MSSRSTVVVDTRDLIIIRIDHTITDSFSRSVDPTATRAWNRSPNRSERTKYQSGEYAPDFTVDGKRCASFIAFAGSFEAAKGALAAHLDRIRPADSPV